MDHCPTCEGISDRFNIPGPGEYKELARQLIGMVSRGALVAVKASCPLEDIFKPKWPSDIVTHDFQCTACRRTFHLFADTYHGRGSWKFHDVPNSN
jgi:hypothetical protein